MEIPSATIKDIINQLRLAVMLITSSYEDTLPKINIDDKQDVDVLNLLVSKLFSDCEDIIAGSINVPVVPNVSEDKNISEESNMLDSDTIKSYYYMQHIKTGLGELKKTSKTELLYRIS